MSVKEFVGALVALLVIIAAINLAAGAVRPPWQPAPVHHPNGPGPSPSAVSPSVASTPSPTPSPSPSPTFVPTPLPSPFTISGRGRADSAAFQLPDVDYEVSYRLGSCAYSATLDSTDGTGRYGLVGSGGGDVPPGPITGPASGSIHILIRFPGTYIIAMSTDVGCPWSVTFATNP